MKRKLRLIGASALAIFLALITFSVPAFSALPAQSLGEAFDYGLAGDLHNEVISADELLETLLGGKIPDSERYFLTELSDISFRYNSAIPDSTVSTQYDESDRGRLMVWVTPYSYTANNGTVVTWIPFEARIGSRAASLTQEGDRYFCEFEDPGQTDHFYMDILFEWNVEFPKEAVAELINLAFAQGDAACRELAAYEVKLEAYNAQMAAYEAYVTYMQEKAAYDAYLLVKTQYEQDLAAYLDYVDRYNRYVAEKTHYDELSEAWRKYREYKTAKENYVLTMDKYEKYQASIGIATDKLRVLENLFIYDSNNWQLYGSLMGNMVTLVLEKENQDSLVAAGCNRKDVEKAGAAAIVLREVMKPYADLRNAKYESEHDRTVALYAYYCANYQALKTNFSTLCTSLKSLCDCSALIMNLDKEGKLLHYRQFVGQLYVTATCLDDAVKRSDTWKVNGQFWHKVVEECNVVPDTIVADPSTLKVEDIGDEVILPQLPSEEVAMPQESLPQSAPVEPTPAVAEPTAPTEVPNPDQNGIPTPTEHPGDVPDAPVLEEWQTALVADIQNGKLAKRLIDSVGKSYRATASVKRLVPLDNRKLVSFYAWDGKTLLHQEFVEKGASFSADGINPSRPNNAQYTYEFIGWKQPDGSDAVFVADTDVTLIAQYSATLRSYQVTWVLDGEEMSEEYLYGEMPQSKFSAPEPETGYRYVFSGWSPAISPVTKDVTYRASYRKEPIVYTVTWDFGDHMEVSRVPYLGVPSCGTVPMKEADSYEYAFLGWYPEIAPVTQNVTYSARYSQTPLALSPSGAVYRVEHTATALVVECSENLVDLRVAADFAQKAGKGLLVKIGCFTLEIAPESVAMLGSLSPCTFFGLASETPGAYGIVDYSIAFFDAAGEIDLPIPMKLFANVSEGGSLKDFYLLENDTWLRMSAEGKAVVGKSEVRSYPVSADQDSVLNVDCTQESVDLREAANFAWGVGKGLTLKWEHFLLTVAPEHLDQLYSAQDLIRLDVAERTVDEYGVVTLTLGFFDEKGKIDMALPMTLQILASDQTAKTDFYLWEAGNWQKLENEPKAITGGLSVRMIPVSPIRVEVSGVCDLSQIPASAPAGTLIDLGVECLFGYEITELVATLADGTEIVLDNGTFYMPNGEVFVKITISQIVYEVTYRVDGKEIFKKQYAYGEKIDKPENPVKASDGVYDYSFLKWSMDVERAIGDERVIVIDAVFASAPVVVGDPYLSGNNNNFTLTVIVPIVGSVLLVGIVTWVVIAKKRKKRKAALAQSEAEKNDSDEA